VIVAAKTVAPAMRWTVFDVGESAYRLVFKSLYQ
jgi:hypothetical protein